MGNTMCCLQLSLNLSPLGGEHLPKMGEDWYLAKCVECWMTMKMFLFFPCAPFPAEGTDSSCPGTNVEHRVNKPL